MKVSVGDIAVVIPLYKALMTEDEQLSFRQCLRVLSRYPIVLATHAGVDLSIYRKEAEVDHVPLSVEFFDPLFFDGIAGYNRLMLNKSFYARFRRYRYMLVYQLDAFVFEDSLLEWAQKGFDYIGAPWGKEYEAPVESDMKYWMVGNGGLSLRRVDAMIGVLGKSRVLRYGQLRSKYGKGMKSFAISVLKSVGYNNSMTYWIEKRRTLNEDAFLMNELDSWGIHLSRPTPLEASVFSFEQSPEVLYRLIGNKLPFACHAWRKYSYESFWRQHIEKYTR